MDDDSGETTGVDEVAGVGRDESVSFVVFLINMEHNRTRNLLLFN